MLQLHNRLSLDTYRHLNKSYRPTKTDEKNFLLEVADSLDVSLRKLSQDECDDWAILAENGNIHTDGHAWYVYIFARSKRHWSGLKTKMSFMELVNDGDDEGRFRLERMPSPKEAAAIRKVLGLKKRPALSVAQKRDLPSNFLGSKPPATAGSQKKLARQDHWQEPRHREVRTNE